MKKLSALLLMLTFVLMACSTPSDEAVIELPPTDTLQPIPSMTQRVTATIRPTNTDIPTFTPTATVTLVPPTASNTPTATLIPTVVGIVNAINRINVRSGPDATSEIITSLPAGTGVQIIGQNEDFTWYNIRILDDEDLTEGWMASRFIFVENTPTPFPTATASPDLTALFLGTPLPATQLVPGRATATPPSQVRTGTAVSGRATIPPVETQGALPGVPTIDNSAIFQTATALAGGISSPTPRSDDATATEDRTVGVDETQPPTPLGDVDASVTETVSASATPTGREVRVFAYCDDETFALDLRTVPTIRSGDSLEIWWGWIASTEDQVLDHIENSNLELSVNGETIPDANDFVGEVQVLGGSSYIAYWEVPFGPLDSGDYVITYQVTWDQAIYDGTAFYGPETANPFEQHSCSFSVN